MISVWRIIEYGLCSKSIWVYDDGFKNIYYYGDFFNNWIRKSSKSNVHHTGALQVNGVI